jgi:hypothetical protein
MKLARFQRVEIPTDTDEWEAEKHFAVRNSGFAKRPPLTTKWTQAISANNDELVVTVAKSPGRLVLRRIAIVERGEHNEPNA